jgi:hypothetical protein
MSPRAPLDYATGVHDLYPISQRRDYPKVVAYQHDRQLARIDKFAQQAKDLRLHCDVKRRRRLVGEQDLRVTGESNSKGDSLTQPAGELVWSRPQC